MEDIMDEAVADIMHPSARASFATLFRRFTAQHQGANAINWEDVRQPTEEMVVDYQSLEPCPADERLRYELLDKLVILKLNGGLGSTMGLTGPKSAIEVRQDLSFLDLTVKQVEYLNSMYGVDVPLVLMNSFKTHDITVKMIRKYRSHNLSLHTFTQSCFPRIAKDLLLPLPEQPFTESQRHKWYPPGHGDVYNALYQSGLLENLIEQGKEYIYISNIDNLGATVDLNIIYHMINSDTEFVMETVTRTAADAQGGVLVNYRDTLRLQELSQLPADRREEFRKPNLYREFNTNSLWVGLRAIQREVSSGELKTDVNVIERQLTEGDPGSAGGGGFVTGNGLKPNSYTVLQLETGAGAAVALFKNPIGINVPRSRFLPVKNTSDLMLVQSSLYNVKHGSLLMNPDRPFPAPPVVKLGKAFQHVQAYWERTRGGVPDVLELEHLTVSGNVYFGQGVKLKGTVIIVAHPGAVIMIPDGTVLENKVVTGNLSILDH